LKIRDRKLAQPPVDDLRAERVGKPQERVGDQHPKRGDIVWDPRHQDGELGKQQRVEQQEKQHEQGEDAGHEQKRGKPPRHPDRLEPVRERIKQVGEQGSDHEGQEDA
jgi:hypothetical protein